MSELELFLDLENRRVAERFPDGLPVTLYANGQAARILNISLSGAKLIVHTACVDEKMSLQFETKKLDWVTAARVVWCHSVGPVHSAVGVEFFDLSDPTNLRSLLQELAQV